MPYHIAKSAQCPTSKPWAVIKDSDGKVMGCHPSHDAAYEQLKALYVHDPNAKKSLDQPIERRYFPFLELRASADADFPPQIVGHAAVFNQPSEEIFGVSGWREVIRPGAFLKAIGRDDVRALINHREDYLIGRISNRTLILEEDDIGLKVRITPPETSYASDLLKLIRGHYMTQMSFGFTLGPEGERIDRQNKLREIVEVSRLYDVSPVTEPAYPQTDLSVRGRLENCLCEEKIVDDQEKERFLARQKERQEFLDRRIPPPDPLSLPEIFKRCRIKVIS
jgi:Escherichia/Staphylococcus phage prohead protease